MRLSRSQYTAIENGKSVINYNHLMSLALVLKVSIQSLIAMRKEPLKVAKKKVAKKKVAKKKVAKKKAVRDATS